MVLAGVIACLLLVQSASAQSQSESGVYIRQATATIHSEPEATTNDEITRTEALDMILDRLSPAERPTLEAFITAATTGHFFLGKQSGSGNTAFVDQSGDANIAVLSQDGIGNISNTIQNGSRNLFGAWLTGDNNELHVEQYGDENIYMLEVTGDGLNPPPVVQQGAMNQALQVGLISQPFGIHQRGNGMYLTIEHNSPSQ